MHRSSLISIMTLSAFGLAADVTVSNAQVAPCPIYGKVKSKNSNTPVTVTFDNMSGEKRGVFWVDFKGNWVKYADLKPGQTYTADTFATHPWIFTDIAGNCVEMFTARKDILTFNITEESRGKGAR
jgi:VHL beta domain